MSLRLLIGLLVAGLLAGSCSRHPASRRVTSLQAPQKPTPAISVRALSFSPDGQLLAVVLENQPKRGNAKPPNSHPRSLVALTTTGRVLMRTGCVSKSVAWTADPIRLIFAVRDDSGIRAVAAQVDTGAKTMSRAVDAAEMGPIGARAASCAFVLRRHNGRFTLCTWDIARGRFGVHDMPGKPCLAMDAPPVVSETGKVVAMVSSDHGYFLAYRADRGMWVKPAVGGDRIWDWRSLTWTKHLMTGRYLVDEKSLALWAVTWVGPMCGYPALHGYAVPPRRDHLSPLDIDEREERDSDAFVLGEKLESISSGRDFHQLAVVYRTDGSRECVLYTADDVSYYEKPVPVGSLRSGAICVSPDGSQVAVVANADGGQAIHIVDTSSARVVRLLPLSTLPRPSTTR